MQETFPYFEHLMKSNVGQPYVSVLVDVNSVRQIKRLISPTVYNVAGLEVQRQHRVGLNGTLVFLLIFRGFVKGAENLSAFPEKCYGDESRFDKCMRTRVFSNIKQFDVSNFKKSSNEFAHS